MANGEGSCTISVGDVGTYTPSDIGLEISDQVDNPTGPFNLSQLREQARPLPYVMTDLLTNRSDIMMLYNYTLPGRPFPNLDFLNDRTTTETTATMTITINATATLTPSTTTTTAPTTTATTTAPPTAATTTVIATTDTIGTTPTPSTSDTPATTPPGGGGATAISYSFFITLVALLVASVL